MYIFKWITETWEKEIWYEQFYIITGIAFIVFALVTILTFIPHSKVIEDVEREFNKNYSRHFFMWFRANKRAALYRDAEAAVKVYNPLHIWYVVKNWSSQIASLSFTATLFLVAGSLIYEFLDSPVNEEYDYGDYIIEETIPSDSSEIHHVDPHWVEGYERSNGTKVEGYWRGGNSGYDRSNPDGSLDNNLRP
ncbi:MULTISPECIES: hypothetical protein [unclassified Sporosarcina]|uniref:hypothetical protein n=1 Tax=unclassified Sporosarcina TaxID=2647733 RepID=UPI000A19DE3A|nr:MULTISPECIES: hypothetical protein [unclassified Sporosarcina]PID19085.1 hypothetical protein CSV62_05660 [Sporosarcina sp. P35]